MKAVHLRRMVIVCVVASGVAAPCCKAEAAQLTFADVYGCPWNADGLVPLSIGRLRGRKIGYRFRAERSGTFTQARFYFVFRKEGYYKGDGGQVLIEAQTDTGPPNHFPSGKALASCHITDPMARGSIRLVTFDGPVALRRGALYHFVFSNPAPDPINNWISLDDLYNKAEKPNMQPAVSDTDLAVLLTWPGSAWSVRHAHTPIYCIYYHDGKRHGQGYADARSVSGVRSIAGECKVREVFTVSRGHRVAAGVRVRVRKTADAGPLVVSLMEDGGALLYRGEIPAAQVRTQMRWVEHAFSEPRRLEDGQSYSLVFSAPKGSYTTFGLVQGTGHEMDTPTVFADGMMQYDSGSGWTSDRPGVMDMQFYFLLLRRLVRPPPTRR